MIAAAAESPPPMIDLTPGCLTIASITPIVPAWKSGFSNTPIGPFQTTVLAPVNSSSNLAIDFGPISRPRNPASTAAPSVSLTSV